MSGHAQSFRKPAVDGDKNHVPAALRSVKTNCTEGYMGLEAGLDGSENICFTGI
jgi:hypothetical protein